MSTRSPQPPDDGGPPEINEIEDVPVSEGISGPFYQKIGKRKLDSRDAKILVTADHAQTGIGKSNLCDFLAYVFDTTERGFHPGKVAIDPEEFFESYKVVEPGSSMVLEEAEQLDSRRAMSKENVESSQTWQKGRVREVIALLNLPSPKFIDKRMEELADFWINVEIRGRARVYEKKIHRIKQSVYYETVQVIHWPNMDGSDTFREMDKLKWDHINDESDGSGWIPRSEVEEKLERLEKDVRMEVRDKWIESLYNLTDMRAKDIAALPTLDISPQRVSQIGRGDDTHKNDD